MKRLIPVLAALAVLSCTKEIQDNVPVLPQHTLEAKLVGGGDGGQQLLLLESCR